MAQRLWMTCLLLSLVLLVQQYSLNHKKSDVLQRCCWNQCAEQVPNFLRTKVREAGCRCPDQSMRGHCSLPLGFIRTFREVCLCHSFPTQFSTMTSVACLLIRDDEGRVLMQHRSKDDRLALPGGADCIVVGKVCY